MSNRAVVHAYLVALLVLLISVSSCAPLPSTTPEEQNLDGRKDLIEDSYIGFLDSHGSYGDYKESKSEVPFVTLSYWMSKGKVRENFEPIRKTVVSDDTIKLLIADLNVSYQISSKRATILDMCNIVDIEEISSVGVMDGLNLFYCIFSSDSYGDLAVIYSVDNDILYTYGSFFKKEELTFSDFSNRGFADKDYHSTLSTVALFDSATMQNQAVFQMGEVSIIGKSLASAHITAEGFILIEYEPDFEHAWTIKKITDYADKTIAAIHQQEANVKH